LFASEKLLGERMRTSVVSGAYRGSSTILPEENIKLFKEIKSGMNISLVEEELID
jgi:hypothetical protein